MARAPFQVCVFPYRQVGSQAFVYALLRRSDAGYWQAVAGGGENGESLLDAARRETREETGLAPDVLFLQLDTVAPVPVTEFRDSYLWGDDVYVIPQYYFGVLVYDDPITLSREHVEYCWMVYEEARQTLRYDADKIALWELNQKIRGMGPCNS